MIINTKDNYFLIFYYHTGDNEWRIYFFKRLKNHYEKLSCTRRPYLADHWAQNDLIFQNIYPITSPTKWWVARGLMLPKNAFLNWQSYSP